MWKQFIMAALCVLALNAGIARADTAPTPLDSGAGCVSWLMCNAQTAIGPCTAQPAAGEKIVVNTKFARALTFDGGRSTGSYTCDFYANTEGYDATSGVGTKINSVSLTETQEMLSYSGVFDQLWVECTVATTVTIVLNVCQEHR